jgi:iron(III) transport system ATP-binding protein
MSEIQLSNLSKSYSGPESDHAAVAGVSLTIASGEFVTLLGPSGCGKTTTLRLIAGYLVPDAGEIRVAGRLFSSPQSVVPPESRGMGMVFQNYAVWPHKTVFQNVAFGLMLRKVPKSEMRERVERVLDLVNLGGLDSRYPSELSGGQQQRVALARSLVVEPAVLLLDEPLSNLDAKLRERMRTELKTLQRRTGITFIYVTHDQSEALALSDHIAVMHAGRLQQYGTPRDVYCEPANHIVADFMGLVNLLPARLIEVTGADAVFESGPARITIPLPSGMQLGARAELAVRPETIRLTASAAALPGAFPARVLEQTYLGNLNEYVLAAGETQLRVQADAQAFFPVGSEVFALIDAQQCRAFASADTETP